MNIHVIPPGINLTGHAAASGSTVESRPLDDVQIGYFSRVCHDKGLHLLVDALEIVERKAPQRRFSLRAAGYLAPEDRAYLQNVERRFQTGHLRGRFHYAGSPDRPGKIAFLQSVDLVCLPSLLPESKGIPALEAWANGTPVIAPEAGAFPELVADTGGGLLFEPGSAQSLAQSLLQLVGDADQRLRLGKCGMAAIRDRYHHTLMAQRMEALYGSLLGRRPVTNATPEVP